MDTSGYGDRCDACVALMDELWLVCPYCEEQFAIVWATNATDDPGPYYVMEIGDGS